MANSDYTVTGAGAFCQNARLLSPITELQTTFEIDEYRALNIEDPVAGDPVMLDDEIMVIVSFTSTSITVGRGCADTIPQAHDADSTLWFFQASTGSDAQEYAATETIAVKVLPKTATVQVPIEGSPPNEVQFNFRFARPYAPGLVKINDRLFVKSERLEQGNDPLTVTWVHRDRIVQSDQMVHHNEASVGPEVGTTYTLKVYKADNTLVHTDAGVTGTSWSYTHAQAVTDFGITLGAGTTPADGYITLESVRDGYTSYQKYKLNFQVGTAAQPADAQIANVKLLLHFNGTEGSTTFVDSSSGANTVSAVSGAVLTREDLKFGSASCNLPSSSSAVQVLHASHFDVTGVDFTWELQVSCEPTTGAMTFVKKDDGTTCPYEIGIDAAGKLFARCKDATGATVVLITDPSVFPTNLLTSVAFCRIGTTYRLFKNGTVVDAPVTVATAIADNTANVVLGLGTSGVFDEVRFTRAGRYSANYTAQKCQFSDV